GFRFFARLLTVGQNLSDAQQREFLTMADLTARILTPAFLERDDLAAAALFQHLGSDCCTGNNRHTEFYAIAADDEHLAEFDDFTGFALDLVDLEHVLGGNPVLLATGFEDREHLF